MRMMRIFTLSACSSRCQLINLFPMLDRVPKCDVITLQAIKSSREKETVDVRTCAISSISDTTESEDREV